MLHLIAASLVLRVVKMEQALYLDLHQQLQHVVKTEMLVESLVETPCAESLCAESLCEAALARSGPVPQVEDPAYQAQQETLPRVVVAKSTCL